MSLLPLLSEMEICYGGNESVGEIIFLLNSLFGAVGGRDREQGKGCGDTSWRKPKVLKYGSGVGSDNLVCVRCFHSWKEGESFLSHPPMIEMNSQWCEFPSSSNLVSN